MKIYKKQNLKGKIILPASKSLAQRYLIAAFFSAINGHKTVLENYSSSTDFLNLLASFKKLGLNYKILSQNLYVNSFKRTKTATLDAKNSAFNLRALIPICMLEEINISKITIKHSIESRIIKNLTSCLEGVTYKKNIIKISKTLDKGVYKINAKESSQVFSGLLFSLAYKNQDAKIIVKDLSSKPFIDMTINVLKDFNVKIKIRKNIYFLKKSKNVFTGGSFKIKGDTSIACFYALLALKFNDIKIFEINKKQGEFLFFKILKEAGLNLLNTKNFLKVKSFSKLKPFDVDITDFPDLISPLSVLALHCSGTSTIRGIARLKYKECNRPLVMFNIFKRLNIKVKLLKNVFKISGCDINYLANKDENFILDSYNDHRILMAFLAFLIGIKNIYIKDATCVNKSYPDYFKDLKSLGLKYE